MIGAVVVSLPVTSPELALLWSTVFRAGEATLKEPHYLFKVVITGTSCASAPTMVIRTNLNSGAG